MQLEFDADPTVEIQILAVNEEGHEGGVDLMSTYGDLPLLQDTEEDDVWNLWDATYRDVIILDSDNMEVAIYNLTNNNLSDEENYETLKSLLMQVAKQ